MLRFSALPGAMMSHAHLPALVLCFPDIKPNIEDSTNVAQSKQQMVKTFVVHI